MIRTTLTLAAAAILIPAAAHAQAPCSLLTADQIKAVLSEGVNPGQAGGSKDSPECTWRDAKGESRVYLSVKDESDYHSFRASMQATGKMVPITGVGEDAFFVSSAGSSAALYSYKKKHLVLLTVDGPGYSKAENEAAEQALAVKILARL